MIEANDPRPRLLAWWDCAVHAHRRLADPSVIGRDAYLATCSALIAQEQIEHLGEETGRSLLVLRGHDRVVQLHGHDPSLPWAS